jgi:hypothetical protein
MNIHPNADSLLVAFHPLEHSLAHNVPETDSAILTRSCDERLSIKNGEAASYGELLVLVALVRLLN